MTPDSGRWAERHPLPVRIVGTGRYTPERFVASATFDERWKLPVGTTERECGVARRFHAAPTETSAYMGAAALRDALKTARMEPDSLDCIVSTTSVMQQAIPCLGAHIQAELGLGESGIPAFDVNATCLSFLSGLDLVAAALAVGRFATVGLVASEIPSVGLDPSDRATAPLFGDGAAAAIVTVAPPGSASCLLASALATYGVGAGACRLRAAGTAYPAGSNLPRDGFFEMDGKAIYRLARRYLPDFVASLLQRAQMETHELDCVVPHQASGYAIDHMVQALGFAEDRVVRTLPRFGNQVSASLPNALHEAIITGRLSRGGRVLLLGTGAGLALGGAVLVY